MCDLKCYVDKNGFRRAETKPGYEVLGWFLEQDIQSSINSCKEMLEACSKIKKGIIPEWSGTGNAHTVTITQENVVIENEFSDSVDPIKMPLESFIVSLGKWMDFISQNQ